MRAPLGYGKEDHFVKKGYKLHGVIHVGMNDGEEITWYWHVGRLPVLAFEPVRSTWEEAFKNYRAEILTKKVHIVNCGLGSETKLATIRMARNLDGETWDTKGASVFPIHPDIAVSVGWVPPKEIVEEVIQVYRFDDWVKENYWDISPYNTLVIDVQGMELEVLQGFGKLLKNFPFIMAECSHPPVYDGEADAVEVEAFLNSEGFIRDSPIVSHNDVMFVRSDLVDSNQA